MSASKAPERQYASSSGSSEASDPLDMRDEEGWEDAEPDNEVTQFVSLFDKEVFTDITSMLEYCKSKYNFHFLAVRQRLGLDFYGSIKLINYIRSQTSEGKQVSAEITAKDFEDEKYLKPVLEDDALIFNLDELPDVEESTAGKKGKDISQDASQLVARVSELEEELRRMQTQFDNYRATVSETLDQRWNDRSAAAGPSGTSGAAKEEKRDDDTHYFSSYSYNGTFPPPSIPTSRS
jgi:protein arginine N-methyltransferase 3